MLKQKLPGVAADEQLILEHSQLRLLTKPEDILRCDQAIIQHHYLHNVTLVGEHLRYAVTYRGKWLAVATWSSAAFHLKDRDQFIGWTHEQCRTRRPLLANNSRLLVLPECQWPNLISRFMKLMLEQLSQDWEHRWGHPLALVETFVDPRFYQGTAFRVCGWSHLGPTAGWKRDADDFYQKNDAPKQIWVRELSEQACVKLRAPSLPPEWAPVEAKAAPRCTAQVAQIRSLHQAIRTEIAEFRRPEALAYPIAGMLCLMVMAAAQGVMRGPQDLAEYADTLSSSQLRALGFRNQRANKQEVRCPKKTTFTRILHWLDDDLFERVLLAWQDQILGPTQDRIVIIDGKKIRHAGVEIVNAVNSSGRFLGSVITDSKSNEIPAGRKLLAQQDLTGKLVQADALHTQTEHGQQILYEQGGDYLFTVKANQLTIQKTLASLFTKQAFSPSAHDAEPSHDPRAQPGALGDPRSGVSGSDSQPSGFPRSTPGGATGNAGQAQR